MYVHIHTCIYIYVYAYIYTHMYVHMYVYLSICLQLRQKPPKTSPDIDAHPVCNLRNCAFTQRPETLSLPAWPQSRRRRQTLALHAKPSTQLEIRSRYFKPFQPPSSLAMSVSLSFPKVPNTQRSCEPTCCSRSGCLERTVSAPRSKYVPGSS